MVEVLTQTFLPIIIGQILVVKPNKKQSTKDLAFDKF